MQKSFVGCCLVAATSPVVAISSYNLPQAEQQRVAVRKERETQLGAYVNCRAAAREAGDQPNDDSMAKKIIEMEKVITGDGSFCEMSSSAVGAGNVSEEERRLSQEVAAGDRKYCTHFYSSQFKNDEQHRLDEQERQDVQDFMVADKWLLHDMFRFLRNTYNKNNKVALTPETSDLSHEDDSAVPETQERPESDVSDSTELPVNRNLVWSDASLEKVFSFPSKRGESDIDNDDPRFADVAPTPIDDYGINRNKHTEPIAFCLAGAGQPDQKSALRNGSPKANQQLLQSSESADN